MASWPVRNNFTLCLPDTRLNGQHYTNRFNENRKQWFSLTHTLRDIPNLRTHTNMSFYAPDPHITEHPAGSFCDKALEFVFKPHLGYRPPWGSPWSSLLPPRKCKDSIWIGHDFLPNPYQFTRHHSSLIPPSMLYSVKYWEWHNKQSLPIRGAICWFWNWYVSSVTREIA